MKIYTNLVFVLIGIVLSFLLLLGFKKQAINLLGGYTKLDQVVKIDTTYLPIKIDTIAVFNDYVHTKGIILNPEPIIKYVYPASKEPKQVDFTKTYNVSVKDSLIDGIFNLVNDNKGNLLEANFDYKPLFPKYIEKRIPYEVTRTVTNTITDEDRFKFGIGFRADFDSHVGGSLNVLTKKDLMIGVDISKKFNTDLENPEMPTVIGFNIIKFF